jgi:hypothetical protein
MSMTITSGLSLRVSFTAARPFSASGHVDVHDNHIGPEPAGQLYGSAAVFGLGHHFHFRPLFDQRTQPVAHDPVVIGQ